MLQASRCTPFCALYGWASNSTAGTQHAAAIHMGKSPDSSKLGLGVWEISIVAGTGADVMSCCAASAILFKGQLS